jgi:hypothetical protein
MSVRSDDCRRRAEDADQKALEAREASARADYEEIARQWRAMAEQADRLGW